MSRCGHVNPIYSTCDNDHSMICSFAPRHNSTTGAEIDAMVAATGFKSIDALIDATVPSAIRRQDGMKMGKYTAGMTESDFLAYFK